MLRTSWCVGGLDCLTDCLTVVSFHCHSLLRSLSCLSFVGSGSIPSSFCMLLLLQLLLLSSQFRSLVAEIVELTCTCIVLHLEISFMCYMYDLSAVFCLVL